MKRNLVKTIFAFLLLAFVTPAVFAKEENYQLDIKQSVSIPGGKASADDSTATFFWDKTTDGEIELSYTITVPDTKKKKRYSISFRFDPKVQLKLSSNKGGWVSDKGYDEKYDVHEYKFFLDENCSSVNEIEFTMYVPEYYKGETISVRVDVDCEYKDIFGSHSSFLGRHRFAIKVR